MADLVASVRAFCALLRAEYDIDAGHDRAREALRALEAVRVFERERVRLALRLSLCSSGEQLPRFDAAFEAFFGSGIRRMRRARSVAQDVESAVAPARIAHASSDDRPLDASTILAARYSAAASAAQNEAGLPLDGLSDALAIAGKIVASLRLGRSRRWKPHIDGQRFDFRGTLRSSLHTGGDPVRIRTLGHPFRNPRIVLIVDASRSMSEYTSRLLQFAYALTRRSGRVGAFVFSTALRDITRQLRRLHTDEVLQDLGEAWGGGTRIGAALSEFEQRLGSRVDADTLVIIASDGFDEDAGAPLQRALRNIHRRSAGIIWLNPHAHTPGFHPSARAMNIAMPYIHVLLGTNDTHRIPAAARRLRR